jgi:hypothetical protein
MSQPLRLMRLCPVTQELCPRGGTASCCEGTPLPVKELPEDESNDGDDPPAIGEPSEIAA